MPVNFRIICLVSINLIMMTIKIKNMHRVKFILILFIIVSPFFSDGQLSAQEEIQKEVRVVKPYTPTLSEANKISLLPEFNDTIRVNPNYGYTIYPKRFETDYKINPIKPARMVGMPIAKLYKSQLTLGAGNYMTPYMELTINQLRARHTQLGFYYNHQSSTGKIKLDNGRKVEAGYNDNLAKLYGKKIFKESVLEADISGGYNSVLYYGYNHPDTLLGRKENMQKIYSAGTGLKYYSMHSDSFHLNYKTGLNYKLVNDYFKNTEQMLGLSLDLNKRFNDQIVGGDIRLRYFNRNGSIDSAKYSILDVNPWYSKNTDEWKFLIGLNVNYDQTFSELSVFPHTSFEFNIVPKVLVPYLGIDGYNEVNNYGKIIFENPYITPGTVVSNAHHSMIIFAGLKGRYSKKASFNLKGSYEKVDQMYFYVNDTSDILLNKFTVVYDNMTVLSLGGEVSWLQSEKLQFVLKGNYYKYELDSLDHPWHKPEMEVSLAADYNLRDKILVGADIFYTGKRYAQGVSGSEIPLKGYLDANLSAEYRYKKTLSFFIRFNNLTASRYQVWNQYPAQRFQFLAGFSYSL